MKYIYDPPIIPLRKGDFEDSPLFKGGRGGYKTVPHKSGIRCIIDYLNIKSK